MSSSTTTSSQPPKSDDIPPFLLTSSQAVTTHDPTSHHAIFHPSTGQLLYQPLDPSTKPLPTAYVSYIHSTPLPTVLTNSDDITAHFSRDHSSAIGMPNGIIAQMMLYRPGMACPLHRTMTLDYGVVLEGQLEVELDCGVKKVLERGDVIVQRGTMHAFRNIGDVWAKAFFVGVAVEGVNVEGKTLEQDLKGFVKGGQEIYK